MFRKIHGYVLFILLCGLYIPAHASTTSLGVGGGGSFSGISFDPYHKGHLYIATDMGLVYESYDQAKTWQPISQQKITFSGDLDHPAHMGFSPNGNLYWARGGCDPQISRDNGVTWAAMPELVVLLPKNCESQTNTRLTYWFFSDHDNKLIGAGTTSGLFISKDSGASWSRFFPTQQSLASLVTDNNTLIHASSAGIFKLNLDSSVILPLLDKALGSAAMGKDTQGVTLVGVEKTDNPTKTMFIKQPKLDTFTEQKLPAGPFVRMSPNNSSVIYFTGTGSDIQSIWMSQDSGNHWSQRFTSDQANYNEGKTNPSAVGLYVGFWDDLYFDVQVSPADPAVIATGGNFFFKLSTDAGVTWQYPYSNLKNLSAPITRASLWKSTQLNPVSAFVIKRNPANHDMIVAGFADIGCQLSLDNGKNWRMCNIPDMNSVYDIEFNPNQRNQIYAAASTVHDFPQDWHSDILNVQNGGLFVSDDAGLNWQRLSPDTDEYRNPYLSLAIDFKQTPCHIFGGTQGKGIIASFDCGVNWKRVNNGFESMDSSQDSSEQKGSLIFPSIKISPLTHDVYAVHGGNRLWLLDPGPDPTPYMQYTGLYKLNQDTLTWKQLGRPPVKPNPPNVLGTYWKYPIDFAVDWDNPSHIYLADLQTAGGWNLGGVWYSPDEGATWEQSLQFSSVRKILIKDGITYAIGWSDLTEPFIYKATHYNDFMPLSIDLPIHYVNSAIIDDSGYFFTTFGGGVFRFENDNPAVKQ